MKVATAAELVRENDQRDKAEEISKGRTDRVHCKTLGPRRTNDHIGGLFIV